MRDSFALSRAAAAPGLRGCAACRRMTKEKGSTHHLWYAPPLTPDTTVRDLSHFATLDDFLDEEGIREEVTLRAVKSVIALQLRQAMKDQNLTRAAMAARMDTSRAQLNRVLDPDASNVTLDTLSRAARVLGHSLKVELV